MKKSSETASYKGDGTFAVILRGLLDCSPKTGGKTTYKALAAVLNVKQQSVSSWAVGTTIPDTKHIAPLADYFNVSCDYLLGRDTEPTHTATDVQAVIGHDAPRINALQELYSQYKCKRGVKQKDRQDPFYNAYNAVSALLYKDGLSLPGLYVLHYIGLFLEDGSSKAKVDDPAYDLADLTDEAISLAAIAAALKTMKENIESVES
ncbi:hypothetical protein FACS18949_04540 [Clostridia bacterium]|nr:hypothetical protein FACS18949_04540 [Clostridia bacterium]